jgi:hypothetical protein
MFVVGMAYKSGTIKRGYSRFEELILKEKTYES